MLNPETSTSDPLAYSVPEFCQQHRISRAMFYVLVRDGRGPRLMKVGKRTLISVEAAADWRKLMEAQSGSSEAA